MWQRYQRPLLIAETGAEEEMLVPWARYIDVNGCRSIYEPLALELRGQQICLAGLLEDDEPGQAVSA